MPSRLEKFRRLGISCLFYEEKARRFSLGCWAGGTRHPRSEPPRRPLRWPAWHDAWRIGLFVLHNNEWLPLLDITLSRVPLWARLAGLFACPSGICAQETQGQRVETGKGKLQTTFERRHRARWLGADSACRRDGSGTKICPPPFSVEKTPWAADFLLGRVGAGQAKAEKRESPRITPRAFALPKSSCTHLPIVVRTISSSSRVVSSTVKSVQSSRTASWAAFSGATSRWLSL